MVVYQDAGFLGDPESYPALTADS